MALTLWLATGFNLLAVAVLVWVLGYCPWLRPRLPAGRSPYPARLAQRCFWLWWGALALNAGWVVYRVWFG